MSAVLDAALRPVDRVLDRWPMYRIVTAGLTAIVVVAVVLAAAGALVPYTPGAIVVSTAVAVVSTVVATLLAARIAGVRPHLESSVITGLLIGLLMWPQLDWEPLAVVAAAGFIAGATKYLIAVRGRHIFNPAALGVFVVGLLAAFSSVLPALSVFAGAVWWAGRPELIAIVAVAALAVVRRARGGDIAVAALVAGVLSAGGRLVLDGGDPLDAIRTVLVSYPLVFLVGFMLTEPFTAPTRRIHRVVVGVVVGVLFGLAFQIGPLYSSPELALLVGNAVAFLLARPRTLKLRMEGARRLTDRSVEVAFTPTSPVRHRAGEYLELSVPHRADRRGSRRVFTIASAPGDERIALGLRLADARGSSYKRELTALEPGTVLHAGVVGGDFVLPRDRAVPLLLVAGGIGVTPFISQLREEARLVAAGERARDLLLVYRVRDEHDLAYRDELVASGARVLLVAPDAPADLPETWHHATDLDADALRRVVPEPSGRSAFVSGSPSFVSRSTRVLRGAGVRRIRTDRFSGY